MGLFDLFKKRSAPPPTRPPLRPPGLARLGGLPPHPQPQADNHFVVITLDSCRFDTFMEAAPKVIPLISGGKVEKRYTYASWTAPSHYNLLTGLLPHTTPPNVYASEYYKEDFFNYNMRLGSREKSIDFGAMVPGLWLPDFLRNKLGYTTNARVSLPVLNERTGINRMFDSYKLMDSHNDMASMLPTMQFPTDRPSFWMLNVGETHYPYAKPDEDSSMWPRISGVNGVFKKMAEQVDPDAPKFKEDFQFFDQDKLDQLRARQVDTVRYLDGVFEQLYDLVPKNTYVIVTADHGELFGEAGYFGHGPIMHEKCYEVPYLEGKVR
ncbi:MAG TPA: sulfatase-like hydrolase/transferase [Planctomycetota bacterium]|nr:sulfatase-like hydrolase/transferase [Planctomycetota bacterium]